MKTAFTWVAVTFACVFAAIGALFVGTQGDYAVARLVTEDPSLPSVTVAGIHMRDAPYAMVDRLGLNVARFQGPVLMIIGDCNNWLESLQYQHFSRFANAEQTTIPDAGHDVVWDNSVAALAAFRRFLNR